MSLPEPSDKNGEDPIQATEQERSAAFEWLRDVALSLENDIPISFEDRERHARYAAVALQAWHMAKSSSRSERRDTTPMGKWPDDFESCPRCHGSFSFNRPSGTNLNRCPYCLFNPLAANHEPAEDK